MGLDGSHADEQLGRGVAVGGAGGDQVGDALLGRGQLGAGPCRRDTRQLVLARIERRRKARKQSRDALSRARELAAEIGHKPLLAEIEQELPRIAPTRSGGELTATEQRVADLIAAGATNRDAAAELFVSVRTVETHVASIYRKLGVRTRAELARKLPASQ